MVTRSGRVGVGVGSGRVKFTEPKPNGKISHDGGKKVTSYELGLENPPRLVLLLPAFVATRKVKSGEKKINQFLIRFYEKSIRTPGRNFVLLLRRSS